MEPEKKKVKKKKGQKGKDEELSAAEKQRFTVDVLSYKVKDHSGLPVWCSMIFRVARQDD